MITRLHLPQALALLAVVSTLPSALAQELATTREAPKARPRLTDSARLNAEETARENREIAQAQAVAMDKVEVRAGRLPSGPAREPDTVEQFSATGGGYLLKKEGTGVTTEFGLWRHISVIPHEDAARDGNTAIRMGLLRINW